MSQPPSEERRKFVFVFTGPVVDEKGIRCEDIMSGLTGLAKFTFGWKVEESHCVPTTATIQIGGKPSQIPTVVAKSSPNTSAGKTQQSPTASKPPSLTVEIVRERLAKWLDKVEVTPTLNGFAVKPRHFLLRETWQAIDDALRTIGAKWIPQAKGVGSWIVPS